MAALPSGATGCRTLAELYECHSDNPDGCLSYENPKFDMPASFSYHLSPVFKTVKK
jgi:hypothetical protein